MRLVLYMNKVMIPIITLDSYSYDYIIFIFYDTIFNILEALLCLICVGRGSLTNHLRVT